MNQKSKVKNKILNLLNIADFYNIMTVVNYYFSVVTGATDGIGKEYARQVGNSRDLVIGGGNGDGRQKDATAFTVASSTWAFVADTQY